MGGKIFLGQESPLKCLASGCGKHHACATTPAIAAGISDRNRIELGLHADLVQVRRINAIAAYPRSTWVAGKRLA